MIKTTTLAVALLASLLSSAHAASKYQEVTDTGIIPLEMATTVYSFDLYRSTPAGMEVCFEEYRVNLGTKCNRWISMAAAIPQGKTLVGWRIGHQSYGHRVLDIYFK